jgi:hypothetical protein
LATRPTGIAQIGGAHRPAFLHDVEDGGHVLGTFPIQPGETPPNAFTPLRLGHPEAQQRLVLDRQERCLVTPILEELTIRRHSRDEISLMGSKASEQRQLLAAHDHVDGVDLHESDASEDPSGMTAIDAAGRSRIGKSLRGQRDPPGSSGREPLHLNRLRSP